MLRVQQVNNEIPLRFVSHTQQTQSRALYVRLGTDGFYITELTMTRVDCNATDGSYRRNFSKTSFNFPSHLY